MGRRMIRPQQIPVATINLEGRVFMSSLDSPFVVADRLLASLDPTVKIVVVDFHAEATSEKQALGFYLDGRASLVVGTHTHVPTADERILPGGRSSGNRGGNSVRSGRHVGSFRLSSSLGDGGAGLMVQFPDFRDAVKR